MKRRFTLITAAVMLLTMMALPKIGRADVTWERVTSVQTLLDGGTFIIGYEATANSGIIIPMANVGSATTSAAGFMYSGSEATSGGTGTIDMSTVTITSSYEVEIGESSEVSGAIFIKIGTNYLGNTNTKNNCKLFTSQATTTSFTPTIGSNDNFTLDIEANTSGSAYRYLKYNTGSPRFAVYSTTPEKIVIYKKVGATLQCATPTFSPAQGVYYTNQSVTIITETEDATIYYTTDGNDPTTSSSVYSSAISVNTTQTIKAIAAKASYDNSSVASATYTILEHAGTALDPYTVADARAAIDAGTGIEDVHVTGIVCTGGSSLGGGKMNYWISDDGTETNKFEIYKGLSFSGASFSATTDVCVGDVVVVYGNITKFNTTYEFSEGSTLQSLKLVAPTFSPVAGEVVSGTEVTISNLHTDATIYYTTDGSTPTTSSTPYSTPIEITSATTIKAIATKTGGYSNSEEVTAAYTIAAPVATPTFSPVAGTYTSIQSVTISCATDGASIYYTTDGSTPTTSSTLYSAAITVDVSMTIKAIATKAGMANSAVASADYTINLPAVTYTKTTSIESGRHYIIVGIKSDDPYAMGLQNSNNRAAVTGGANISLSGDVASVYSSNVYEFVIIGPDVEGFYTIYDANALSTGYLYAASSSKNYMKTQSGIDNNARWNISFDGGTGVASVVATNSSNNKVMRFNSGSSLFSCYASATQSPVYLYVKDGETPVSYTKDITAYSSTKDHYNLIAPPVGQVTPTAGNYFLANYYDLYCFDQSKDWEWRNYEANSFNLVSGRGYLYANSGNVTLTFEGYPYVGNGQVMLAYSGDGDHKGYNLIGNPLAVTATIPGSQAYYTLNGTGSEFITGDSHSIAAKEGIFVVATAEGQSVTFTPSAKGNAESNPRLVLNLNENHGDVIDRAIIRFDEGQTLPKFMLDSENTKLYITQGSKDYAVLRSDAEGEMPLNFKASENGTYTLSVEPKDVEMDYLHLIDKVTGADIDLLTTPSYSFEANTGNNANRFRLVFAANDVDEYSESTNFAYFNGSEWVIENDGQATLQVIDVMGRMLRNEIISGNATTRTDNLSAGVYVMRLVNGEKVKTQKIVVEQ